MLPRDSARYAKILECLDFAPGANMVCVTETDMCGVDGIQNPQVRGKRSVHSLFPKA
jgi:formylmethanofuran dehydrogenase subunit E